MAHLLDRAEMTFLAAAREKGLRLRVVSSDAVVRSDFILLERILFNLVSNAIRYTANGGVTVGCRRRAGVLRVEIWDSGIGIPEDQRGNIFGEFYQVPTAERDRSGGLGFGLAIVDRLCRLLKHPIEVTSQLGRGSRFAVSVPLIAVHSTAAPSIDPDVMTDPVRGKLILVIDDDALVLSGMEGVLKSWDCSVVTASSEGTALARLLELKRLPDLIISDYHLGGGKVGFKAIERLRNALGASIPAFVISGDTAPERLREAKASGYYLLHKPVLPITLRAVISQLMKDREEANPGAVVTASHDQPTVQGPAATPSPAIPPQQPPPCDLRPLTP
jgi:CheY-like chemotaxis protein